MDVHDDLERRFIVVERQAPSGAWVSVGAILLPEPKYGLSGGFRYDNDYAGPALSPLLDYTRQADPDDASRSVEDPRLFRVVGVQGRGADREDLLDVFAAALPGKWGTTVMGSHSPEYLRSPASERLWMLGDWRAGALRFSSEGGTNLERFIEGESALQALREQVNGFIKLIAEHGHLPRGMKMGAAEDRWALATNGGAVPKCAYRHEDGREYVAKFSRREVGSYEDTRVERGMLTMSQEAGIDTVNSMLIDIAGGEPVLCTQRFDVSKSGTRLHKISMATALGQPIEARVDYTRMAEFLRVHGAPGDVEELYRRMLFNGFARNSDDHLGNFEVLQTATGWRLAPAFDLLVFPTLEDGTPRPHASTLCGHEHAEHSVAWIREAAAAFSIDEATALRTAQQVLRAIDHLPDHMLQAGVSRATLEQTLLPAVRPDDVMRLRMEIDQALAGLSSGKAKALEARM